MSTYAPGTVAVATVRGVKGVRVVRTSAQDDLAWFCPIYQPVEDGNGWWPDDHEVTDVRPLVVLDPKVDRSGKDAAWWLKDASRLLRLSGQRTMARVVESFADQIEAQIKPPRIDEPGLWAVVEASIQYRDGKGFGPTRWVHTTRGQTEWYAPQFDVHAFWGDLISPTLVREGLES